MPAFRSRALLLCLLLIVPATAQARLTLGWVEKAAILGSENQSRRLAAYLESRLGEPVSLRHFTSETQLHEWLHRYRMVDLAPLSAQTMARVPAGELQPLARLTTGADSAQLVVRQNLGSERESRLRTVLAKLAQDPAGRELLAALGGLRLEPAGGPPRPRFGSGDSPPVKENPVKKTVGGTPPEPPPSSQPATTTASADEPPVLPGDATLTRAHDYVSRNIEILADKIDAFFGTNRAFEESSGTYIQARGSLIYRKHGNLDFDGNVRARLDLPNLKEKLSLVFESEPENDFRQRERIITGTPAITETFNNKDFAASLQYILREEPTWDIRLQPGIKLHWPPETFIRLRGRRIQPISENWLSRFTLTPGWFDSRGWELRLRHDFDRDTGSGSLFRASSEAIWLVKEDRNVQLVQSFSYAHPLGRRVQMAYEAGVIFETSPTFWDNSYFSSIRYRRNIHRNWLFLEFKPQLIWEREHDFKADPSVALSLEVVFGARTLVEPQK